MPAFAQLSEHHESVLFKIVRGRELGLIDSDSFKVEEFPQGLLTADRQIIPGSLQDLMVLAEAKYLSVRTEHVPTLRLPEGQNMWFASLTALGRAYYRRQHSPPVLRAIMWLQPSAEDTRRVLYSGALATALVKALDAIGPWVQSTIDALTHLR